ASFEVVPASVCQDGVLPAQKTTVAKCISIAIEPDLQGLPDGTGRVLEREVLRCEVIGIDQSRSRAEGPNRFAVWSSHPRMQAVSQYTLSRVIAFQAEKPFLALDVDQFFVDARLYVNDPGSFAGARGRGIDRVLHGFELPISIWSDRSIGRRCEAAADQKCNGQQASCEHKNDSLGHPLRR